jgi:hypothetical protein
VHADLKEKYEADHIGPPAKKLPYEDLMSIPEYKAAYNAACAAAEPKKGERPDRDPQVGCDRAVVWASDQQACKGASM